MTIRTLTVAALLLGTARIVAAQDLDGGPMMGPPAFLEHLFVPAMVMRHQQEIGLTESQREAISKEMAATQQKTLAIRWRLEEKSEALAKLVAATKIDETAALGGAGEVLDLERQMKEAHLALLVRIKNQLTPAQQEKLGTFRRVKGFRGRLRDSGAAPEIPASPGP